MVENGQMAPEFTLTSDQGETVRLADFRGRKVVLYFYPKADTPGCTTQACAIRDGYPRLQDAHITVLGISPDAPAALAAFREKYALPFPLLSDPDHQVAGAYGAWGEKKMYGKTYEGIIRSHFAIDEAGRVTDAKIQVKPETTVELAFQLLP